MRINILISFMMLILLVNVQIVFAAPLIYHGNNPNISPSASSFNAAGIDSRALLTRPKEKQAPVATQTDAELIRRSVVASLSSTISQQIQASSPGEGRADFGDGSYAVWSTSGNTRTITTYNVDGTSTAVSYPLVQ